MIYICVVDYCICLPLLLDWKLHEARDDFCLFFDPDERINKLRSIQKNPKSRRRGAQGGCGPGWLLGTHGVSKTGFEGLAMMQDVGEHRAGLGYSYSYRLLGRVFRTSQGLTPSCPQTSSLPSSFSPVFIFIIPVDCLWLPYICYFICWACLHTLPS